MTKTLKVISICLVVLIVCSGCSNKQKAIQRKVMALEEEGALAMQNMDFKTAEEKDAG